MLYAMFGVFFVIFAQINADTIPIEGVTIGLNVDLVHLVMLNDMNLVPSK